MFVKSMTSVIVLATTLSLSLVSCSSSKKKGSADGATQAVVDDALNSGLNLELNGDSDSMRAGALNTVFFAYDSSALNSSTRATLEANIAFLKENTDVEVQVEGHCDERGGIQYNLALGERRAKAVKDFMVASGVESRRITTVSYGKERPLEFGHDESAWSKNRRANFVVTAK